MHLQQSLSGPYQFFLPQGWGWVRSPMQWRQLVRESGDPTLLGRLSLFPILGVFLLSHLIWIQAAQRGVASSLNAVDCRQLLREDIIDLASVDGGRPSVASCDHHAADASIPVSPTSLESSRPDLVTPLLLALRLHHVSRVETSRLIA
jgi:hypothetical protein